MKLNFITNYSYFLINYLAKTIQFEIQIFQFFNFYIDSMQFSDSTNIAIKQISLTKNFYFLPHVIQRPAGNCWTDKLC